jgi:hypothetical protein
MEVLEGGVLELLAQVVQRAREVLLKLLPQLQRL